MLNGILVLLLIKTLYPCRFLVARNQALLWASSMMPSFVTRPWTSDSRTFLIFLKLLLILQQLVIYANSVLVTWWRIQTRPAKRLQRRGKRQAWCGYAQIKCIVFKLCQRSCSWTCGLLVLSYLSALGLPDLSDLRSPINPLNRLSSFLDLVSLELFWEDTCFWWLRALWRYCIFKAATAFFATTTGGVRFLNSPGFFSFLVENIWGTSMLW